MQTRLSKENVKQFTMDQFNQLIKSKSIKNLVRFHTNNKYLLMAHNPRELKILGNLVANRQKKPFKEIFQEYSSHLDIALDTKATIGHHANVLIHIYRHFREKLSEKEKKLLLSAISDYANEKIPLGKILNEIERLIRKYENKYLLNQTYYLLYSDVED